MSKTQVVGVVILAVIVVGLSGLALQRYETRPKTANPVTVAIDKQKTSDDQTLAVHDAVASVNAQNAQTTINTFTTQRTALCAELKQNKLTNPVCP